MKYVKFIVTDFIGHIWTLLIFRIDRSSYRQTVIHVPALFKELAQHPPCKRFDT